MRPVISLVSYAAVLIASASSCAVPEVPDEARGVPSPTAVIDLGAVVTEDLPERFAGKGFLAQMGFEKGNSFEVIAWEFPMDGGTIRGSNAYYTFYNHGGPHVDAPIHTGAGEGLDSYPTEAFVGPVKAFDVSGHANGRSIPADVFRGHVAAGDVVLVFTRYSPPTTPEALPDVTTLTHEAAEFLASLPVRAYGTDSFSIESLTDTRMPSIHHSFLSRGIPVYEQLVNVNELLDRDQLLFVGAPLNIEDGDGMMVRPIVLVFE